MPPPRFLLVDDHALFRAGLALLLAERWPSALIIQAGTWQQALSLLQVQAVDVVLLDLHLPDAHGLRELPTLQGVAPQAKVIAMSAHIGAQTVSLARSLGVVAVLAKSVPPPDLLMAVQAVLRGESAYAWLPYASLRGPLSTGARVHVAAEPKAAGLGSRVSPSGKPATPAPTAQPDAAPGDAVLLFTPAQIHILELLGQGRPNQAIARLTDMSESVVRAEVAWIMACLQVDNRRDAFARAKAQGLIAP